MYANLNTMLNSYIHDEKLVIPGNLVTAFPEINILTKDIVISVEGIDRLVWCPNEDGQISLKSASY